VLANGPEATQELDQELTRVLKPYIDAGTCQIGFVLITTKSPDIESGIQMGDIVADHVTAVVPDLLPNPGSLTSESVALPNMEPVGEVTLQIFWNTGCTVTPVASPAP